MTEVFTSVARIAEAFGPAAGMGIVFTSVLLYLYRRDHLVKQGSVLSDRTTLLEVVTQNTATGERLAEAVNRLAETNRASSEATTRQIEIIVRAFESRAGRRDPP